MPMRRSIHSSWEQHYLEEEHEKSMRRIFFKRDVASARTYFANEGNNSTTIVYSARQPSDFVWFFTQS